MKTAAVLTRYQTRYDGNQPINIPALFNDVIPAVGDSLEDITEQPTLPPTPNIVLVKAVVSPDTLAKIKLHPLYGEGAVLWEDGEDFEQAVPAPRFQSVVHYLAQRLRHISANATDAWVKEHVLGAEPNGRSLIQIIDTVLAYLRQPHPAIP